MKFHYRIILMIISGALAVMSFPLADKGWLIWLALVPGIIAASGVTFRQGFILGEIFGFIFHFFVLDWFGIFGWEPRLVGGLFFGLYQAIVFALWAKFTKDEKPGISLKRVLLFPLLWVFFEWFKTKGTLAFTFGHLGYTQHNFVSLIQLLTVTGIYGISFVIVTFNALIAESISSIVDLGESAGMRPWKKFPRFEFWTGTIQLFAMDLGSSTGSVILRNSWVAFLVTFLAIITLGKFSIPFQTGYGAYEDLGTKPFKIGVVQPNLAQAQKWKSKSLKPTLDTLRQRTKELANNGADMVAWPETAIPHGAPLEDVGIRNFITGRAKTNKVYVLTGIINREQKGKKEMVYNGAVLVDPKGQIVKKYNKIHLVPFGEYLPLPESFRKYQIFQRTANYDHGKILRVFKTSGGKFSILICFESMFDYLARLNVQQGADFLMILTNDAWFEKSNASYNHFIMATYRAVENRAWVIQVANTGISGAIDPWGRVHKATDIFVKDSFNQTIYPMKAGTFYTKAGNWFPIACLIVIILLLIAGRKKGPEPVPEKGEKKSEKEDGDRTKKTKNTDKGEPVKEAEKKGSS